MGKKLNALAAACAVLACLSCQKYVSDAGAVPPPPTGGSVLFRMQLGNNPNMTHDSVWTVSYNAIDKPSRISDSISGFTATATYDVSQRISDITTSRGDEAVFLYNINGLLNEIKVAGPGHQERYEFSYVNNIVSKKSYYTDNGTGRDLVLTKEYLYTIINNNITAIKEQSPSGDLLRTENFSFDIAPNAFKDFSLFSYAMFLDADHLIDAETYFNKNLLTKATVTNNARVSQVFANTYTLNDKQFPIRVISENQNGTFNWAFTYR
jgi:hypothetical protein